MHRWPRFVFVIWLGAIGTAFVALYAHAGEPGIAGTPPRTWPADGLIECDPERWTLIVFAHPRCPCTRATMAEFERFFAIYSDQITTAAVLFRPEGESPSWTAGPVVDVAQRIPDLQVLHDEDGVLTRSFGVQTSGHILAYAPSGQLAFSGGITNSRGHEGKSAAITTLSGLITGLHHGGGPDDEVALHPIFGCPIIDSSEQCEEEGCLE